MKSFFKYFRLIFEGKTFLDKIIIFAYLLIYLIFHKKVILRDLTLENKEGFYFCGKSVSSFWVASTFAEPYTRPYLNLGKGVFVDIGANIGKYSILVGKKYPQNKIIAIEPELDNLKLLHKNISLNNLDNVIICPFGAYSKEGKSKLYLSSESNGSHSLLKESDKYVLIKLKTLDRIMVDQNVSKVDLIKIDVEGAELDVLKGARKIIFRDHPKLLFEAWNFKKFKKVESFLVPFGYKIKKISDIDYFAYVKK
jgi:FkbM family methyltransferase